MGLGEESFSFNKNNQESSSYRNDRIYSNETQGVILRPKEGMSQNKNLQV